jgi:hypothetical protein
MTVVTELTGNDARVTIRGIEVGLADISISLKGSEITQPRMGEPTPRKLPGPRDLAFDLTCIDIDGDLFALAMADATPTCARLVIENCDASTNWVSSMPTESPIAVETAIKYEGTGSLKITSSADPSGNTITGTVAAKDMSGSHVLEYWVRSTVAGAVATFGFGESAITEQTQAITIHKVNTWQREVIFLSEISSSLRNAVTKVGFTLNTLLNAHTLYIDNINALTGFTFGKGQYFTLTAKCRHPTDPTQYFDVFIPDAFLTSGDIAFADASKAIDAPYSGSVKDASKVVISYSQ